MADRGRPTRLGRIYALLLLAVYIFKVSPNILLICGVFAMAFRASLAIDPTVTKRAALYLRVSTGRQAANDVSIPSQRELTRRYCEAHGWIVMEEFVEPGASATEDRRPVFQRSLIRRQAQIAASTLSASMPFRASIAMVQRWS